MKRVSGAVVLSMGALAVLAAAPVAVGAQERRCSPGTGPDLSGQTVTAEQVEAGDCPDLSEADLSGLDLGQADLDDLFAPGANLRGTNLVQAELNRAVLAGADLTGARLIQADLQDADLSGANLTDVEASQIDAPRIDLSDADLSGSDFTQATLTGGSLANADAGGASFTQAHLGGVDISGIRGVRDYSTYLLIGAGVFLLLLLPGTVKRAFRPPRRTRVPTPYQHFHVTTQPPPPPTIIGAAPPPPPPVPPIPGVQGVDVAQSGWSGQPAAPPVAAPPVSPIEAGLTISASTRGGKVLLRLVVGLIGSFVIVLGLHAFAGGMVGSITEAINPLQPECSGPHCAVGIDAGWMGLSFGIPTMLAGFALRAAA
jgi:uncharacterized protein YjbI with pentapeptide repeats